MKPFLGRPRAESRFECFGLQFHAAVIVAAAGSDRLRSSVTASVERLSRSQTRSFVDGTAVWISYLVYHRDGGRNHARLRTRRDSRSSVHRVLFSHDGLIGDAGCLMLDHGQRLDRYLYRYRDDVALPVYLGCDVARSKRSQKKPRSSTSFSARSPRRSSFTVVALIYGTVGSTYLPRDCDPSRETHHDKSRLSWSALF